MKPAAVELIVAIVGLFAKIGAAVAFGLVAASARRVYGKWSRFWWTMVCLAAAEIARAVVEFQHGAWSTQAAGIWDAGFWMILGVAAVLQAAEVTRFLAIGENIARLRAMVNHRELGEAAKMGDEIKDRAKKIERLLDEDGG